MKTLAKYLPAILFIALVVSCRKNNTDPSDPPPVVGDLGCRLISLKWDTTELTTQYDATGRVSCVTGYDSSVKKWYDSFEYLQDRIIERDSIPATATDPAYLSVTITHELGSNGFVVKSYLTDYEGVRDTTYHTYNSDGYRIRSLHRHYQVSGSTMGLQYTESHDYTISGGNRIKDSISYYGSKYNPDYQRVFIYGYYPEKLKYVPNLQSVYDYTFLGKMNQSLVKTADEWHSAHGADITRGYTYHFDEDGKPVRAVFHNNNDSAIYRLGYECFK